MHDRASLRPLSPARVSRWTARRPWSTLVLWFAISIALLALDVLGGEQRSLQAADAALPIGESAAGMAVFSNANGERLSQRFDLVVFDPDGRLADPAGRAAVADMRDRLDAARAQVDGRAVPVFESIADPFTLAAADPSLAPVVVSPDGRTVLIDGLIAGPPDEVRSKVAVLPSLLDSVRAAHPGLEIRAFNQTLLENGLIGYATGMTGLLLLVSLPITFLLLLIAFRAAVAAAIPLVLGLTAIVGASGLVGLYSRLVEPVSPFAVEFVVLIGLAVAIDYSLFVVTRFRRERASRDRLAAIDVASATAGRAVLVSGVAVVISMASLAFLDDPLIRSMAVGSISAVVVSLVGSAVFLPAALAVLDTRVDRGALPVHLPFDGTAAWARLVRGATAHAVPIVAATLGALVVASLPLAGLRLGYVGSDLSVMPSSLEAVQAARMMDEAWPRGSSLTLDVIVTDADDPQVQATIPRLDAAVAAVDGVAGGGRVTRSVDGSVARVSFALAGSSNDAASAAAVEAVRSRVIPTAFGGTGARVYVSGPAAYALDYTDFYAAKTPLVVAFVLALSFVLLLLAFRSIAIPIKAILLNLLSAGAAFGVLVLVFERGAATIDASNPVVIFAILFGLSMDYHVFILTRVKEARDRGLASAEAVVEGISATSGTVTCAAAIMVSVFAGFALIRIANIQQFGVGLAVAVLIDATVVRSLLLPATMRLLGEWNWWLPRFLGWLPRVEVERVAEQG